MQMLFHQWLSVLVEFVHQICFYLKHVATLPILLTTPCICLGLLILRLSSGLGECLRNSLNSWEEWNHGRGEALGAALLLLGCGSAAPSDLISSKCFPNLRFESSHLSRVFYKCSFIPLMYSFLFGPIFVCIDILCRWWWPEGEEEDDRALG